jgi:hypothetical protein
LQRRLGSVILEREKIKNYIATVPDSLIRQILTLLRYLKGLSWQKAANHIDGGNTADSLRKMHNRFLGMKN